MFSVTMTSKSAGRRMRCIAQASTSMCDSVDVGEVALDHALGHLAPQARRLEHVGLVDRGQLAPAAARQLARRRARCASPRPRCRRRCRRRGPSRAACRRSRSRRSARARPPGRRRPAARGAAATRAISFGLTATGRRLAYRPSPLRMASNPCSGRTLALGSSHFGPPTAPSSTASAPRHSSSVSSGSAVPVWSIAQPPIRASRVTKTCPQRLGDRGQDSVACATTSGPIPSPGRTATTARMSERRTYSVRRSSCTVRCRGSVTPSRPARSACGGRGRTPCR